MATGDPAVVVLRGGAPGLSAASLRDAIRDRVHDRDVALARTPAAERELARSATVLVGNEIDESLLDDADDLRLFAHTSTGVGWLPMERFAAMDVAVTNASGLMPQVAEQAVGMLLVFARDLLEGARRQRRREARHYQPVSLSGRTVTVVGLGSIGRGIAARLDGFDVETIGVRHTPSKGGPTDSVYGYDEFQAVLPETDHLVLTCPLTETTRGLVGTDELFTLPPDAVVVNVARGAVVDTAALTNALQRGGLGGAALDVTDPEPLPREHPLWTLENVLLTPHNAGNAADHWSRVADLLARNLQHVDETGSYADLENLVLAPSESV